MSTLASSLAPSLPGPLTPPPPPTPPPTPPPPPPPPPPSYAPPRPSTPSSNTDIIMEFQGTWPCILTAYIPQSFGSCSCKHLLHRRSVSKTICLDSRYNQTCTRWGEIAHPTLPELMSEIELAVKMRNHYYTIIDSTQRRSRTYNKCIISVTHVTPMLAISVNFHTTPTT